MLRLPDIRKVNKTENFDLEFLSLKNKPLVLDQWKHKHYTGAAISTVWPSGSDLEDKCNWFNTDLHICHCGI